MNHNADKLFSKDKKLECVSKSNTNRNKNMMPIMVKVIA